MSVRVLRYSKPLILKSDDSSLDDNKGVLTKKELGLNDLDHVKEVSNSGSSEFDSTKSMGQTQKFFNDAKVNRINE